MNLASRRRRTSSQAKSERIAFHEAGHAVAAWSMGLYLGSVTTSEVTYDKSPFAYWWDDPTVVPNVQSAKCVAAIMLAGIEATLIQEGTRGKRLDEMIFRGSRDLEEADTLSRRLFSNPADALAWRQEVERFSKSMLKREWPRVAALANELLKHPNLTGDVAVSVIESASPLHPGYERRQ